MSSDVNSEHPLVVIQKLFSLISEVFNASQIWKNEGGNLFVDSQKLEEVANTCGWLKYEQHCASLRNVDLNHLSEDQKASFFINLYNLIYIHSVFKLGAAPWCHLSRLQFLKSNKVCY